MCEDCSLVVADSFSDEDSTFSIGPGWILKGSFIIPLFPASDTGHSVRSLYDTVDSRPS